MTNCLQVENSPSDLQGWSCLGISCMQILHCVFETLIGETFTVSIIGIFEDKKIKGAVINARSLTAKR